MAEPQTKKRKVGDEKKAEPDDSKYTPVDIIAKKRDGHELRCEIGHMALQIVHLSCVQ